MGSTRSRQGSAALSHVQGRASRLAFATAAALLLVLLAAAPAMAGTARVSGTTLFFTAGAAGEVNNVTVADNGDGSYTISDVTAPVVPGASCVANGDAVVCTPSSPIDLIWVDVDEGDDSVAISASTPARIFGKAGNDTLNGGTGADVIDGEAGDDTINVQDGVADVVRCGDGSDNVTFDRNIDVSRKDCEINDDGLFPTITILAGPLGPAGNTSPHFDFVADEPVRRFLCAIARTNPPDPLTFSECDTNTVFSAPTEGEWIFKVYAEDDVGAGGVAELPFVVDTTPFTITLSGPASPVATSMPTFEFNASEANVRTECAIDGGPFLRCSSPYTVEPLADGDHVFEVRGTDLGRNVTTVQFPFRISTSGGGTTPTTPAGPIGPRRIVIDSLVLISGAGVKMSRRGVVGIRLTCAGSKRCKGRMRITTAEPVSRKSRKLVTLGSKRFSIGPNKKRKVKVRFSKSKRRLAKRLKRFKAKVVITEVDQRGNPRISSRVFILRAR